MTQIEKTTTRPQAEPQLTRIRLTYAQQDGLRYVSHLDMHLVWERTLRRAGVPLAYSQGFRPHPRLHLASALPLGFLSRKEIADFWIQAGEDEARERLPEMIAEIQASAPPGLVINRAEIVPLSLPALQTQVQSAEFIALPLDPIDVEALKEKISALLEAPALPRERRGKPYDLRPLVLKLDVHIEEETRRAGLYMHLSARERATGRPEEVLLALGFDPAAFRVERTELILE